MTLTSLPTVTQHSTTPNRPDFGVRWSTPHYPLFQSFSIKDFRDFRGEALPTALKSQCLWGRSRTSSWADESFTLLVPTFGVELLNQKTLVQRGAMKLSSPQLLNLLPNTPEAYPSVSNLRRREIVKSAPSDCRLAEAEHLEFQTALQFLHRIQTESKELNYFLLPHNPSPKENERSSADQLQNQEFKEATHLHVSPTYRIYFRQRFSDYKLKRAFIIIQFSTDSRNSTLLRPGTRQRKIPSSQTATEQSRSGETLEETFRTCSCLRCHLETQSCT